MSPHVTQRVYEYRSMAAQYARWARINTAHAECLRFMAARWTLKSLEAAGLLVTP